MESPEIRPTGNGSPRHAEEPFFQSRSLEEPPFAGESFDTDRVLMEQPHQGGATTPDNSEAKSCSEGDPLTAETEGGTRGESNAPEAQHIALDPPSDDGPCHSDDLDAMRHKLRAAEQRADNNQKRLAQVQAASRRDKARWEEERARLNKQVDDLREVVDAGVKEREVLESSVNQLANQLESRLTALSGNVEERDAEVSQLRDENEKMSKAFEEMRMLLKQSVDHRAKLNEEMLSMERQLARARKEASESQAALEKARRDHMEANMSLAEAQADADRWKADGGLAAEERERLHSELEDARRAAEKALQDLAGTREQLEAAEASSREANEMRLEAERLRREAQAEAQSALCAAEAERVQRAEAEGQSEQLKSESERRARVFNNAVKAAVHKIQRELEEENASLQERVRAAEAAAAAAAKRVKEAEQAAAEAYNEAAERSNDAEAAGNHAVAAQEAADRAKAKEQEAERRAEDAAARCKHAERAREQLETELRSANAKAEASEAEVKRLTANLAELRQSSETRTATLEAETRLLREKAEAAVEGASASSARAEALEKEAREVRRQAEETQAGLQSELQAARSELAELQAAKAKWSGFSIPSGQHVLAQLGLDKLKEERLEIPDGKARAAEDTAAARRTRRTAKAADTSGRGAGTPGLISTRSWVIIVYVALLHLVVMISYTKRHDLRSICAEYQHEQDSSFLPDSIAKHGLL
mmetsp:Transcript_36370/g.86354  ORF Transcript_36370/g.86354 Transcript_36370/m.86354 type:complete len:710 (+) Transcript_36370:785-2914(+)